MQHSDASDMSITSLPPNPQVPKKKPSTLRLQESDADSKDSIKNKSSTGVGESSTSIVKPLASPLSARSFATTASTATSGWVSPLDVHFSRPATPTTILRPTSYLPRLQFPEEVGQNVLLTPPAPIDSVAGAKSVSGSIYSDSISASSTDPDIPKLPEIPRVMSPTLSPFPYIKHSRGQSARSIFPMSGDEERCKPSKNKSFKHIPIPPQPQSPESYFPPQSIFEDDDDPTVGAKASHKSSDFAKRIASYRKPQQSNSEDYSIFNKDNSSEAHPRTRSRSSDTTARNRSRSSSQRSKSMIGLARVGNSIRIHARKNSRESINKAENRRSRERDQMHYDPRQHSRNRSGSVQGRKVDFDQPRESPFSNSYAISNHSASNSISSEYSIQPKPDVPREFEFHLNDSKPDATLDRSRQRSASETSQNSIGEFYDSYYRHSTLARRASQMVNKGKSDDVGIALSSNLRRPPPVKVGSLFMGDTIVEVATPTLPLGYVVGGRFPVMI